MRLEKILSWILVVAATIISTGNSFAQQSGNLPVQDFEKGLKQSNVQILDVRTAGEYQSGHLKDAFLADWTNQPQFVERVEALDKSKPVYTYCLSGGRSSAAAKWLREKGFTVYNLEGGITAWKKAGMPIEEMSKVKQMTLEEYQSLIPTDKTVLVDVGAVWCPPCKKMEPIIDALAKEKPVVKVDGGEQIELLKKLNIDALPTFIIYKNSKEVWRKSGIVDAEELVQHLQ